MTAPDPNRQLLDKWATALTRVRVYQTPHGLDVESNEHFEVTNTRVFYDDVQLVTLHREYGALYLTLTGLFTLGFLILLVAMTSISKEALIVGVIIYIMFGSWFTIAFLIRALWGVDVVTVFGRRSKAVLRYRFRKKRARETYGKICAAVRAAQRDFRPPAESPAPLPPEAVPPLPPAQ